MTKQPSAWFATTAFAGLAISLISTGAVMAQPPGRGPGGVGGPGGGGPSRGGPPNVGEMFSRMDKNKDGKLTKDEVPDPIWSRLSNADSNDDGAVSREEATKAMAGRRPGGDTPPGRPDGDRSRGDDARGRGPRPPMDRERGEDARPDSRSSRDSDRGGPRPDQARPEHGRPAPERSGPPARGDSDSRRSDQGRSDNADRGSKSFGPDMFFDRLDKNNDGSISRDEFKAVAALHSKFRSAHGSQAGPSRGGPGGPPWARGGRPSGFDGRRGGQPWANAGNSDRGSRSKEQGEASRHDGRDKKSGTSRRSHHGQGRDAKSRSDQHRSHHGSAKSSHRSRDSHRDDRGHGDNGRGHRGSGRHADIDSTLQGDVVASSDTPVYVATLPL